MEMNFLITFSPLDRLAYCVIFSNESGNKSIGLFYCATVLYKTSLFSHKWVSLFWQTNKPNDSSLWSLPAYVLKFDYTNWIFCTLIIFWVYHILFQNTLGNLNTLISLVLYMLPPFKGLYIYTIEKAFQFLLLCNKIRS